MTNRNILNTIERKFILFFGDLILVFFILYSFAKRSLNIIGDKELLNYGLLIILLILYFIFAYVFELYKLEKNSQKVNLVIWKTIIVSGLFVSFNYLILNTFLGISINKKDLALFFIFTPIQILLWRSLFDYIFKFVPTVKKVLFIIDEELLERLSKDVETINGSDLNTYHEVFFTFKIKEDNYTNEDYRKLHNSLLNVNSIIIQTRNFNKFNSHLENLLIDSIVAGKEVISYSSFYENIYEALPLGSHNQSFYEVLNLRNRKIRYLHKFVSFFINFILSFSVGLIFIAVIPFVVLLNIFFNKGPLFYTQSRIGYKGKEFKIYKFRSMVTDAEKLGAKMAVKNDSRITPFGRLLRKLRIDEVPQIISVIKGDMVFIGPRPERPIFVSKLIEINPFYNSRHLVKPGITGWAQVNYKYGENLEDSFRKLEYDLYYIKNQSITIDLKIIFKTISTVLFSRGT